MGAAGGALGGAVGLLATPAAGTVGSTFASAAATGERTAAANGAVDALEAAGPGAKAGSTIDTNKAAGDAAADRIAAQVGVGAEGREAGMGTTLRWRRIDVLATDGTAIESKVGYTTATKTVRTQIAKDLELLARADRPAYSVEWWFSTSAVTGRGGPSPGLRSLLGESGITVRMFE